MDAALSSLLAVAHVVIISGGDWPQSKPRSCGSYTFSYS
jgi:hypothetical protein